MRPSWSTPFPASSTSTPCESPGASPSRSMRNGNRPVFAWAQHEMYVTCLEPVRDAATGPIERDLLTADRPLAGEGPPPEVELLGQLVEAGLVELVPVR